MGWSFALANAIVCACSRRPTLQSCKSCASAQQSLKRTYVHAYAAQALAQAQLKDPNRWDTAEKSCTHRVSWTM